MPGLFKWLTRWFSKPNSIRGELSNRVRWKYRGQWKVGEDHIGNEYYLYQPFEETPIRRFCLYKDGDMGLDTMPFLWYQWVRYQRNHPPTPEELQEYQDYLIETKRKADSHETRDRAQRKEETQFLEQQRTKMENDRKNSQIEAQQEIISMFAEREKGLRIAAENKMSRMKDAESAMKVHKDQRDRIDKMNLELEWRSSATKPSGSGETFKPGAWRPGSDNTIGNENENDFKNENDNENRQIINDKMYTNQSTNESMMDNTSNVPASDSAAENDDIHAQSPIDHDLFEKPETFVRPPQKRQPSTPPKENSSD